MILFIFIKSVLLIHSVNDLFSETKKVDKNLDKHTTGALCNDEYYGYPHHRKKNPMKSIMKRHNRHKRKEKHFDKYSKEYLSHRKGPELLIPSKRKYKMVEFDKESEEE